MLAHLQRCVPRSWRVSSLQMHYKSFTKRCILEPPAPRGSGGRSARSFPNASNPLQILIKRSILEPLAPGGWGDRSARSFPNASNPLQILYKRMYSGASGASWLRRPIRQILSKCFKSFTNPLQNNAFWNLRRLMAQEAGSAKSFPNASNHL